MSHRCRPASRLVAQMLVASTEPVIIDGVDPQSVTVMRLSEWRARDIPATWFQREFLPRYQAGQ